MSSSELLCSERKNQTAKKNRSSRLVLTTTSSHSTCLHHNKIIISHTYAYCGIRHKQLNRSIAWLAFNRMCCAAPCISTCTKYLYIYISKRLSKLQQLQKICQPVARIVSERTSTFSYAKLKLWNSYKVAINRTPSHIAHTRLFRAIRMLLLFLIYHCCCCCSCTLSFPVSLVAFYLLGSAPEHLVFTLSKLRFKYKTKRNETKKKQIFQPGAATAATTDATAAIRHSMGTISMFVYISSGKNE